MHMTRKTDFLLQSYPTSYPACLATPCWPGCGELLRCAGALAQVQNHLAGPKYFMSGKLFRCSDCLLAHRGQNYLYVCLREGVGQWACTCFLYGEKILVLCRQLQFLLGSAEPTVCSKHGSGCFQGTKILSVCFQGTDILISSMCACS